MTKPGYGVRFVPSVDPRWRGVRAGGGGVLAVFLNHIAGLCRALLLGLEGTHYVHHFHLRLGCRLSCGFSPASDLMCHVHAFCLN